MTDWHSIVRHRNEIFAAVGRSIRNTGMLLISEVSGILDVAYEGQVAPA